MEQDGALCEKCPDTEFFLVRIRENTGQKKLRIWTNFTELVVYDFITKLNNVSRGHF